MEFIFVTEYDQKAYTAMAKVVRKTTRSVVSMLLHAARSIIIAELFLGMLLLLVFSRYEEGFLPFGVIAAVPGLVIFALVFILPILFGDRLTGFFARRRALPGTARATAVFTAESYTVSTDASKAVFYYSNIDVLAETTDYFVFVLGKNHAVILSKKGMSKGSPEAFRQFIEEKTNKKMIGISLSKTHPSH